MHGSDSVDEGETVAPRVVAVRTFSSEAAAAGTTLPAAAAAAAAAAVIGVAAAAETALTTAAAGARGSEPHQSASQLQQQPAQ